MLRREICLIGPTIAIKLMTAEIPKVRGSSTKSTFSGTPRYTPKREATPWPPKNPRTDASPETIPTSRPRILLISLVLNPIDLRIAISLP
jgi:hypothetical protein